MKNNFLINIIILFAVISLILSSCSFGRFYDGRDVFSKISDEPADDRHTQDDTASDRCVPGSMKLIQNSGIIHSVWEDESRRMHMAYYTKSMDNGSTWSKPIIVGSEKPSISVNENDVYVVSCSARSELLLFRSTDNGNTFTKKMLSEISCFIPSIAVNGSNVHVAWNGWIQNIYSGDYSDAGIYYMRSEDSGDTWDAEIMVKAMTNNVASISIVTEDTCVEINWTEAASPGKIYSKISMDNGMTWNENASVENMMVEQKEQTETVRDAGFSVSINPSIKSSSKAVKKWTFMVYMVGDNNLEQYLINNFENMSAVGSTADVNIVVQFDRHDDYDARYDDWNTSKRYYVTPGMTPTIANALQDLGEVDSSKPGVLSDFINWSINNYPAKHYALILGDHGLGIGGLCEDEKRTATPGGSAVWMSLNELKQALQMANSNNGVKLDIIGFDACLMGMAEVDYQIHEFANISVHSQETEDGNGWPYNPILANLTAAPTMSAEQFASIIVDCYYNYYTTVVIDTWATLSAVNLTKQTNLSNAINSFAQQLITNAYTYHTQITAARTASQTYATGYDNPYEDYTDLYDFAYEIKSRISVASVQTAAQSLMNAINDTVINEKHGTARPDSHGISVYHPEKYLEYYISYDSLVEFVPDNKWDEFLKEYYIAPSSQTMNVLLINDDNNVASADDFSIERFSTTLTNMGFTVSTEQSSVTNASLWMNYNFIVWSDGDDITPITKLETDPPTGNTYRTWLTQYAFVGGRLIIEGGHIAFKHNSIADFAKTVLHIIPGAYVYDEVDNLLKNATHPVATMPNIIPDTVTFTYADTGDSDTARTTSDAVGVFKWSAIYYGGSPVNIVGNGVVAYENNWDMAEGGQIVYFAIDIDDIGSITTQEQIIENSASWLRRAPYTNDVGIYAINTPVNGDMYPVGVRDINATVKNYGTGTQSNFNVSCEINEVIEYAKSVTVFSDDMESGVGGWTTTSPVQPNWHRVTTSSNSGIYSWWCGNDSTGQYENNMNESLTSGIIDLSNSSTAVLTFWHKYSLESAYDYGYVEISMDGGSSWSATLKSCTGTQSTWVKVEVDISTYTGGSNVKIRFRLKSDTTTVSSGWYIDDICINKTTLPVYKKVYNNNQTVTTVMAQDDTKFLIWNYDFVNATDYKIIVKTWLTTDEKMLND
ncbi:MAG: clostripain-related cysteine peptidase, partial [Thermoplasmatales archaeon]|nr:clostripain-related cysteine peptidase [Thermoplasmatales archaeon]